MAEVDREVSSTIKTFYSLLVVNFLMIVGVMSFVGARELFKTFLPYLWTAFFFLGVILLFLTIKSKLKGNLRKFLILTGVSSFSFLIFVVLHNFFYALGVISKDVVVLPSIMGVFEVASFLLAIVACPLLFLVGAIGSFGCLLKN